MENADRQDINALCAMTRYMIEETRHLNNYVLDALLQAVLFELQRSRLDSEPSLVPVDGGL